jgi:integrase
MKHQRGYIFRKGKAWYLRYSDTVLRDGEAVRMQLCKKLADYSDAFRSEKSVRALADEFLQPLNAGSLDVRSTMTVKDFIESTYLPEVKEKKRAATYKNYSDIFRVHVKPRLGEITLRQFRCVNGENLLGNIARQHTTKDGQPLSHNTLQRIKSFLSGVFKTARRVGALDSLNPMQDTSIHGGMPPRATGFYQLPETRSMLAVLPEPARTIVMTAAYTGLRQGELRGLLWKNFTGKTLAVERSVWKNGIVNKPKTASSAASISVVPPLRDALELHRRRMGELAAPDSPIFQSGTGTPLNLTNLVVRVIKPRIERCAICHKARNAHKTDSHMFDLDRSLTWKGFHAFRRGLATTLHQLGVPDKEIQGILRHSNVAVTQASYIKSIAKSQANALDLVATEMAKLEPCNDSATRGEQLLN